MVGGFIQEDKIRILKEYLCKFQAHDPASAEFSCISIKIPRGKTKAHKDLFYPGIHLEEFGRMQFFLEPVLSFKQSVQLVTGWRI